MLKLENKYQIISQDANNGTLHLKETRNKHSQQIKCFRMSETNLFLYSSKISSVFYCNFHRQLLVLPTCISSI